MQLQTVCLAIRMDKQQILQVVQTTETQTQIYTQTVLMMAAIIIIIIIIIILQGPIAQVQRQICLLTKTILKFTTILAGQTCIFLMGRKNKHKYKDRDKTKHYDKNKHSQCRLFRHRQ